MSLWHLVHISNYQGCLISWPFMTRTCMVDQYLADAHVNLGTVVGKLSWKLSATEPTSIIKGITFELQN